MNIKITKNGEYINIIIAESLEIARQLYGEEYDIIEYINEVNIIDNTIITYPFYCPVCDFGLKEMLQICPNCDTDLNYNEGIIYVDSI